MLKSHTAVAVTLIWIQGDASDWEIITRVNMTLAQQRRERWSRRQGQFVRYLTFLAVNVTIAPYFVLITIKVKMMCHRRYN